MGDDDLVTDSSLKKDKIGSDCSTWELILALRGRNPLIRDQFVYIFCRGFEITALEFGSGNNVTT